MKPYQQRVIEEHAALNEKLTKLNTFMLTDDFDNLPAAEQDRLTRQATAMDEYAVVLGERIAAFKG